MLLRASVHVLLQSYLFVLLCVCLSVHVLMQAFVHIPPQESVLTVAILCICMLFYPKQFCEVSLNMALRQIIYKYGRSQDSFYHSPESPERCSLQWLGEGICKHFSRRTVFW